MNKNRKLNRLKDYNYASNGFYFITICTKDRIHWLSKIADQKQELFDIGEFTQKCILKIPEHFPHVKIDEFIIMPNHVHMILEIDDLNVNNNHVGNNNYCSPRTEQPWQTKWSKSISSAIRGFKIGVTKYCRANGNYDFEWQKSFHDRIIRSEDEYFKIKNYIINNPQNWVDDRFYN